jgi:2Fe-2S ferredoxin
MPEVRVKARDGSDHIVAATVGAPLMEALRDGRLGIDGTCGGACSCGTCHVYIQAEWLDRLPLKSSDETMMLEALGEFVPLKDNSRLSCQIPVNDALEGITVEIAPAVE